jgi:hypothetical protein
MLTPDDRRRLQRFCDVCDQIARCRFILDLPKQSHHICYGTAADGKVYDEYPRYDDDDFRAFLTHYRKLRLAQDPTFLPRIMNIVKREGTTEDRALLDHFKNGIAEEEKIWWGAASEDQSGAQVLLSQVELENLILNGDVIHASLDEADRLADLLGSASLVKAVAFFNYLRLVRNVIHYAKKTAEVIRQKGYAA